MAKEYVRLHHVKKILLEKLLNLPKLEAIRWRAVQGYLSKSLTPWHEFCEKVRNQPNQQFIGKDKRGQHWLVSLRTDAMGNGIGREFIHSEDKVVPEDINQELFNEYEKQGALERRWSRRIAITSEVLNRAVSDRFDTKWCKEHCMVNTLHLCLNGRDYWFKLDRGSCTPLSTPENTTTVYQEQL